MIENLPESIRNAISEIHALAAYKRISRKAAYELQELIEQKYLKSQFLAARRAGAVVLSTKAFSDRADRLRRKQGVKVMEGKGSTFRAYAATWNREPDHKGAIFTSSSCNNVEEYVNRGKVCFNHDPASQIGIPFSAENDEYGLLIKGRYLNTDLGRTMRTVIRERLRAGKTAPASLCLKAPCDDAVELIGFDGNPISIVTDWRLAGECSYVGYPAHPYATFF